MRIEGLNSFRACASSYGFATMTYISHVIIILCMTDAKNDTILWFKATKMFFDTRHAGNAAYDRF